MCFIHHYILVRDTGFSMYMQCRKCGNRKVMQPQGVGYQPIDQQWLITGRFSRPVNPPNLT